MSSGQGRVLVTGLGAVTPLGPDKESTWKGMLAGDSGVQRITAAWARDLPVRIAAPAAADPAALIGRVQARRMDRCEQLAVAAAREAWTDADTPEVDPWRLGVAVTSGIGGLQSVLTAHDTLRDKGWSRISPWTVPAMMPNGAAGWISMELGARAGAHALVSACASGTETIGYGIDMIRSGRADIVVAGGTEAVITELAIGGFAAMRALSKRNDEPKRATRPFDKRRDGFVLGEGAGIVVLESEAHAAARGARVYAVAAGAGYSADAYHLSRGRPDGAGIRHAIVSALADAGVSRRQVVHVNAHATSTPEGDPLEAAGITAALGGAEGVVVTSTKSMTGHLLGAAGAVETVAAVMTLADGIVPPTVNLDDLDDTVTLDVAADARRIRPAGSEPMAVLNNSFGFGGGNACTVWTSYTGPDGKGSP